MTTLQQLWRGELPLAQAFWVWALVGGLLVNGITSALFLTLLVGGQIALAFIVGYAISVPYNILVAVGVWRSADRYDGDKRVADLARISTIILMVVLSLT